MAEKDAEVDVEAAEAALEAFAQRWDERCPIISRLWRTHWANLTPFFDYPPAIRKVIYTTNAIESIFAAAESDAKARCLSNGRVRAQSALPRDLESQ